LAALLCDPWGRDRHSELQQECGRLSDVVDRALERPWLAADGAANPLIFRTKCRLLPGSRPRSPALEVVERLVFLHITFTSDTVLLQPHVRLEQGCFELE